MIHVEVLDDGAGMPEPDARGQGLGLRNMRERAQLIGGTLEVAARPQGGTRVCCSYACAAEAEAIERESTPVSA